MAWLKSEQMDVAVFVRTPEEVRRVLQVESDLGAAVFISTSPSARIAAEAAGFQVEAIQDSISVEELEGIRKAALDELDELWTQVCRTAGARGKDLLGESAIRKMACYLASYELMNFRKTAMALAKLRERLSPQRVVAVSALEAQLMNVRCDPLVAGLQGAFEKVTVIEAERQASGGNADVKGVLRDLAINGLLAWRSFRSALFGTAGRVLAVSSGKWFREALEKWQLLQFPVQRAREIGEVTDLEGKPGKDWCQRLMIAELTILWNFLQRMARRNLWWLDRLVKRCDVVVFGYPPITPGLASICVERARHFGVPVVGYQHGPNYGMQWVGPKLYLADYSRCDVFWSWGLRRERMQAVLPKGLECPPVVPLGRLQKRAVVEDAVTTDDDEPATKWDIVFPVTLVGEWSREALRIDAEAMLKRQIEICQLLDRLARDRGLRVLVKPIRGLPEINDPISRFEDRWSNLTWDRSILFGEVAVADRCRVMLTEFPSSPLFEALTGSVPVVAMSTPFVNYTDEIKREMGEGVRWADDIEAVERELLVLLDDDELAGQAAVDGKAFADKVLRPVDSAAVDREFALIRGGAHRS